MFRLTVIALITLMVGLVLAACQSAAARMPPEESVAMEAPTATEVPTDIGAPVVTELPVIPATVAAGEISTSFPPATAAPRNPAYSVPAVDCPLYHIVDMDYRTSLDGSPVPILLYLDADDNQSSIEFIPTVQEIANDYAGRVKVFEVNVNYYAEISAEYDTWNLPAFLLLNGQNLVDRVESVTSKSEVTDMLDRQFANDPGLLQNQSSACILEPLELTISNWDAEMITSPDPILVFYWSASDPNSATLLPQLQILAGEYAGRVKVGTLNIDDVPEAGLYYGLGDQLPALLLIRQGNELARMTGFTSMEEIIAMLDQYVP